MESAELLTRLSEGIATLTTSETWTRWLEAQRRFHRYSFGNCILIAIQRPDATRVAGFHTWRKVGRQVRKGEKGIAILAPIVTRTKIKDEETGETIVMATRPHSFRVAWVFDVAQTDGDELPEVPVSRLEGDDPDRVFLRLLKVAAGIGFTVEFAELAGERNGDCSYFEQRIRVREGLEPAMACKTFAHELAHAILHGPEFKGSRELAELEAESTAYVVTGHLGIDSSAWSFGYVATWAGGGKEAIEGITQSGQRIVLAARAILGDPEKIDQGEAA